MKIRFKIFLTIFVSSLLIYFLVTKKLTKKVKVFERQNVLHLAAVVCGVSRVEEVLVMIRSALIFNQNSSLNFLIVADDENRDILEQKVKKLRKFREFSFEIFELKFPAENKEIWEKLFKPCAAQRLFLPSLLNQIDSIIYVDCDVLFLAPPTVLSYKFSSFTPNQIAAMAPESESRNTGWYTRFARHPFYSPYGLNSGVMLMNLTRMRNLNFEAKIMPIYENFKSQLVWGDQDILNIYFHQQKEEIFELSCDYNYRPDHCMYTSQCGIEKGVKLLHGNRGIFHKTEGSKNGIFREIFKAIEEFDFMEDPCEKIVRRVERQIQEEDEQSSHCNEIVDKFLLIPKILFCK